MNVAESHFYHLYVVIHQPTAMFVYITQSGSEGLLHLQHIEE